MPRELIQLGIDQLEKLFATYGDDKKLLTDLSDELIHRKMPRAVALLAEVDAKLEAIKASAGHGTNTTAQPLMTREAVQTNLDLQRKKQEEVPAAPKPTKTTSRTPLPELSVEEAHALLKVTSGGWVSIERKRRELVEKLSPANVAPEKLAEAKLQAAKINAACQVLLESRKNHSL